MKETKKQMKKRIKEGETEKLESRLSAIEEMKNDSSRHFAALKEIKNGKKQSDLIVKDKEGKVVTTEEEQIKIISHYFKSMLAPESKSDNIITLQPKPMDTPFNGSEIQKSAEKLKNRRSAGPDNIELELIKYAPIEVHNEIANIFNTVGETGEPISELVLGLLRPIQKPKT